MCTRRDVLMLAASLSLPTLDFHCCSCKHTVWRQICFTYLSTDTHTHF